MGTKNILWVINPNAGSGNHALILEKLNELGEQNVLHTTGDNDKEAVHEKLNSTNFELVVVGGGDGTIKLVASELKNYHHNNLAILPLGSANGLATELGLINSVYDLIDTYRSDKLPVMKSDAILINEEHYCFHISDAGLNARVVKGYENQPVRGFLGYGLGFLDELNTEEWLFEATFNNKTYNTLMVFFANAKKYGTGVRINPSGQINDGKFEIGILKEINPYLIGQLLFTEEKKPDKNWLEIYSTTSIEIFFNKKVELQIDGEYIGRKDYISAKIIPEFLTINLPAI